jgi:hypothetical protein
VSSRLLDDRIRTLCAKAVTAGDGDFEEIMSQLQSALHEHANQLRKTAAEKLGGRKPFKAPAKDK